MFLPQNNRGLRVSQANLVHCPMLAQDVRWVVHSVDVNVTEDARGYALLRLVIGQRIVPFVEARVW